MFANAVRLQTRGPSYYGYARGNAVVIAAIAFACEAPPVCFACQYLSRVMDGYRCLQLWLPSPADINCLR